jgi:hypothetical protein
MDDSPAERSPAARPSAHDDLAYIRRTLAASGHLSIVPGKGMVAIGALALAAVWANLHYLYGAPWNRDDLRQLEASHSGFAMWASLAGLYLWGALLLLALLVGVTSMWLKARRTGQAFWSPVLRKAAWGYGAAMALGGILTFAALPQPQMIPPVWLGCYGVALMAAGAVSISPIRWMGACFLLLAAAAAALPEQAGALLAVGFGWLHISFGAYIAWRHDG